jgi:uncharacterized protein YbaP (TraB family)
MRLQRNSFVLFAWALWLVSHPAQLLRAEEQSQVKTKHSLWRVQGKTNSLYLFGSIHFLKKEFYPLPAPIENAYKNSARVVFETDIEQMGSAETREKITRLGGLPAEDTLKSRLSKETYSRLEAYLKEARLPEHALDAYQPWMSAVALLGIHLQRLGYDPEQGVEKYFLAKAQEDKKPTIGLETVDSQLSLFTDLSKSEQEAMLAETLADISRFDKILTQMVKAWETGDAKALDAIVLEEMRNFPELYKKLLSDRNQKWVGTLETLLKDDKDVFVTVGAAHLVGKDSVIELLKKKGFKVEQF